MGDIKLFKTNNKSVIELEGKSVTVEKQIQNLLECHLQTFLGVKFLESEYSTGQKHAGRIDTLGIDENNCPVIIEYKRSINENVVNQGLYYLDWLLDHKAEFTLMVMNKYGKDAAKDIEWENSRVICIAGDYTKFDKHAVEQMNRNIELIRYKKFEDLILLELVNTISGQVSLKPGNGTNKNKYTTTEEYYNKCSIELKNRFEELTQFILNLGEDIQLKKLKWYYAFQKIKTFATFAFQPKGDVIVMWIRVDFSTIKPEDGFSKDVSGIGHHGLGNLEVRIRNSEDLQKAKNLIISCYEKA